MCTSCILLAVISTQDCYNFLLIIDISKLYKYITIIIGTKTTL